jgi:hypothetical protein
MAEEIPPVELSADEIRLRERRTFDAFNEAQASRRQASRDAGNLASAEENKRWKMPEAKAGPDNDTSDVSELHEDNSPAD